MKEDRRKWRSSFAVFSAVTFDVLFGDGCAT